MQKSVLTFADFNVGDQEVVVRHITEDDVNTFGKLSGDLNPLHMDDSFAANTPFKRRVVHGLFVGALISTAHTNLTGPGFVYVGQELNFKGPVFINDTVTVTVKVKEKKENKGMLLIETNVTNQDDKVILQGSSALMELANLEKRKNQS